MSVEERVRGLSRREMIKGTLKAGVYAAPVILSSGRVAAQSLPSGTPFPAPIAFGQDAGLTNVGANASFDVYYTLSTQPVGMLTLLGTIGTDGFGFGGVFPLTLDTRAVTSVKLTYLLSGNPPTSPSATTSTSTLVAALGSVNGARGPVIFVGLVVQEPTAAACQVGPLNQFVEYVDVAILNAPPGITYTISVQPNTLGAPVVVTTATTNGQGNVTVFAPTPTAVTSASAPTAGSGLPTLTLTANAANGNLTTIDCTALTSMARTSVPRAIGITQH